MKPSRISLETPVIVLHQFGVPRLSQTAARKLALALAPFADKKDAEKVTVEDLLNYLPTRYDDRSNLTRIDNLYDGLEASLELCVRISGGFQVGRNRRPSQPKLFKFEVTANNPDRKGNPVVVWWFISGKNAPDIIAYYGKKLTRGARFIAFGKWEWDERRGTYSLKLSKPDELEMLAGDSTSSGDDEETTNKSSSGPEEPPRNRDAEVTDIAIGETDTIEDDDVQDPAFEAIHVGRCVPVYRKLGEFRTPRLRAIVHAVLAGLDSDSIALSLPKEVCSRFHLIDRADALRRIHFPSDTDSLIEYDRARSPAHMRLIFEEFFWIALALGLKRGERVNEPKGTNIYITEDTRASIASTLPFALTAAQLRVLEQIFTDMQSSAPMNRLLQGDVGSGKTIVAMQAMLAAMENGYQTALMVPTEILAEQHARYIKRLLGKTPHRVELLIGSLRSSEKKRLHADIAAGDVQAVIGTHALIQDAVAFSKLGLVVIDEQHRFGVMQRAQLRDRGFHPDVLVMTATPIPRSLAMTAYGDLDVSVIDELPPGRTPIKTVVLGEDRRTGVYKGVAREVRAGHQVYVVYPLVDESEKMDLKDATRMFEQLRDRVFPNFTIGLVHGKLRSADKEDVMRRFVSGEVQILVATTVVEVGVDVPNASLMVIEHAERFGLSQLHQLRGRVGRGADQSFCVLLASDKKTSVARERLGIMEETSDGFLIAEKDLELRGPGEIMGTRQSGLPTFRVGNLVRDIQILEMARKEADYYLTTQPQPLETKGLLERVRRDARFGLAAIG
jgi:ATP-dependent DNA helicase RecG